MIPKGLILPAATVGALLASTQAQATGIVKTSGFGFGNSGFGFGNSGSKSHSSGGKDIFHDLGGSKSPSFGGSHFGISFGKNPGKGTIFDPKGHDYGKDKDKDKDKGHGGKDHGGKDHGGKDKDPFKGGIHFGKDWFKWKNHHGQPGHHHGPDCGDDGGENGNPTPPVPEPATWAFMIVGFGLMGAAMRRRSPQVSATIQYS